ncbi:Uncharacterised protein [Staphylococcus aureus]|nr:Uncharacterised protein [Staphylococcus aureus]
MIRNIKPINKMVFGPTLFTYLPVANRPISEPIIKRPETSPAMLSDT